MSGNKKDAIMKKLGLKGKTKPGDMISKMNSMKAGAASGVGRIEKADMKMKKHKKMKKYKKEAKKKETKPQGKGIVKALGQKGTTGNFKKIEAREGKGAAIGALQNKLAKHRGEKIPFGGKKK